MPAVIRCPSCDRQLKVPESLLGKVVRCPGCQQTFTASAEPVAPAPSKPASAPLPPRRPARAPEEDFTEEPPPRRRPVADEYEEDDDGDDYEEDEVRPRRRRVRQAEAAVIGPVIALMVVASLSVISGLVDLGFRIVNAQTGAFLGGKGAVAQPGVTTGIVLGGIWDGFSIVVAILILVGALKMKGLRSYGLALTTCILAMLPLHCCCLLGLPFGIWGLVTINRPEVADAFT